MNVLKWVTKSMWRVILCGLLIGITTFYFLNCTGEKPIRVGFVAQLTGVQAELGVQERNGVQLAVEEINAAGGVAGRSIELIVRDDQGSPEGAQAADRELIKTGVVAILGHATSGQTIAGLAVTDPARVVMLSPTATTPELSGKEDYFFRVAFSLEDRAQAYAQHVYQGRHITRFAVVYDRDNTAYSKAFLQAFAHKYQSLGGTIVAKADFSSRAQPNFGPLMAALRAGKPEGLLIIAADMDTALIAQRARLLGWLLPLFATAWAQTETLIHNGGQAVEGMEIELTNSSSNRSPGYINFETRYRSRFGKDPSFGAVLSYEAAVVLAAALQKTGGQAEGLAQALVGIKKFKGVNDTFSFNKYGDVSRPFYLGMIHQGKYVVIVPFKATEP
jgi:branched-chain amino acid transport system substrate-binding protein